MVMSHKEARNYTGIVDLSGFTEDPEAWAKHYLRVCKKNGWNEDDKKLSNISLYLTHEAETWYDVHTEWIEGKDQTWAEFLEQFVK